MHNSCFFADLILPLPLNQLFTYSVPENLVSTCQPGKRAIVQFGKKKIYSGIIINVHTHPPRDQILKEIVEILDLLPLVSENQLKFWEWMAEYYMCSIGEVCRAALPSGLRLESNTIITYNEEFFSGDFNKAFVFSQKESVVLDVLKNANSLEIGKLNDIINATNIFPVIKSLYEKGTICIDETVEKSYRTKTEKYIKLSVKIANEQSLNAALDCIKRAAKQTNILNNFLELSGYLENGQANPVLLKVLLQRTGSTVSTINEMIKKNIFEFELKNVSRFANLSVGSTETRKELIEFQKVAFDQIMEEFRQKDVVLLHGVTSSGKTEIYIHLIEYYLGLGKQILYLLPEIALTTQIIQRLRQVFGQRVGVYHSKYSDAERVETYQNVGGNAVSHDILNFQLVVGVRSALFLPFHDLGLIIVDEEHETTFKQYNPAPRYQARDSAIVLAGLYGAKILLGSATPSLESFFNARTGKYGYVKLMQRYLDISLPEIILADVKQARKRKSMKSHFTPILLEHMDVALKNGEQIILFQNRRGFALYVECNACGWIPKCRYCDVSLTYHRHNNQLVCHYCGFAQNAVENCTDCSGTDIRTRGFGTEKVEEELKHFFPNHIIKRLDLDSAKGKHAYSNIIGEFERQKINILVGTQMVSKGLDFDNVSLVGILDANQMLNFPDFRAYERSFQLMVQVGGRAGRKNKQGKVVIQTTSPDNPILKQVVRVDFDGMYNSQMADRKQFKYPPFNRLICITLKHKKKETLDWAAKEYSILLKQNSEYQAIGPEYPVVPKIYEFYLKNILIKLERNRSLSSHKKFIAKTGYELQKRPEFKGILIVYDVDPY